MKKPKSEKEGFKKKTFDEVIKKSLKKQKVLPK